MICFYPAEEEHFSSFICRQLLLRGEDWSQNRHMSSFFPGSNGIPRFVPFENSFDEFVKIAKKTPGQFLDDHTLFPLLVVYHKQRKTVSPKPEDLAISLTTLHFCPACMIRAVRSNGWAFIKRHWTVPGVRACLEHKKKLVDVASGYCGCYSLRGPKWFGDFLAGCCSRCGCNLWERRQRKAENGDLVFARIIHSFLNSKYLSYSSRNNEKIFMERNYGENVFRFRIRPVLHVLKCLQQIKFFVYPDISTNIEGLADIEEQLIAIMDCTTSIRQDFEWMQEVKIGGMAIGDQPSDCDMTSDTYSKYLDSWIEKNGDIKLHLLTILCDRQLRDVNKSKISPRLLQRLRSIEMLEANEFKFMKMVEKVRARK